MELTLEMKELLQKIGSVKHFPVARFELRSSQESDLCSTALNHVCMTDSTASMAEVKARGALLTQLEEAGLVHISYALFLTGRSFYQVYYESQVFEQLCQLAQEGKGKPGFLFDTPHIRRGEVTLTEAGKQALAAE